MSEQQKRLIGMAALYAAHSLTAKSEAGRTFFRKRARELMEKATQEQSK